MGASLAVAGGVWFVVGAEISRLWNNGVIDAGAYTGNTGSQVAQAMGYFLGLGAVITFLAAFALGRLTVRGVRDVRAAETEHIRDRQARERPVPTDPTV